MQINRLAQIYNLGQSIWLDFIDRKIVADGTLQRLVNEEGVRGVTSNPAMFKKAVSARTDYDVDITTLSEKGLTAEETFFKFAAADIQYAADIFKPVYDEGVVKGADGFVSLEVSPRLARDESATLEQARQLWKEVARENLMVKIPGTAECLPAIRQCIAEGINVNVTLLFGIKQYEAVADAYITGLEARAAAGKPLSTVSSVASFFISRIDALVDPLLEERGAVELKGKVAIACAKIAYKRYKEIFTSARFKTLEAQGAKPQRLLWASTGTKNPAYRDTKYVEELIGPKTVNTVPLETLEAFRDHGIAEARLETMLPEAEDVLLALPALNIHLQEVAMQLEQEGIEKFNQPYAKLRTAIEKQKAAILEKYNCSVPIIFYTSTTKR